MTEVSGIFIPSTQSGRVQVVHGGRARVAITTGSRSSSNEWHWYPSLLSATPKSQAPVPSG